MSDEDLFQCGKCKLVLTSLSQFLEHKKEPCPAILINIEYNNIEGIVDQLKLETNANLPNTDDGVRIQEQQPLVTENWEVTAYSNVNTNSFDVSQNAGNITSTHNYDTTNSHQEIVNSFLANTIKPSLGKTSKVKTKRRRSSLKPKSLIDCFQCALCGRCFKTNSHLIRHINSHKVWPAIEYNIDPTNVFICSYCFINFNDYKELRSHLKSHKEKKMFKCFYEQCGVLFPSSEGLLEHVSGHHPQVKYACHKCMDVFDSLNEIADHHRNYVHTSNQSSKKYICQHCKCVFVKYASLCHHQSTCKHSFECSQCGKRFSTKKNLRFHFKTHNPKHIPCSLCDKLFNTQNYLKAHMLSHREGQFECLSCNIKFKRKDLLARHKKLHENSARIECPYKSAGCNKTFTRSDKIKQHLKVHAFI